MKKTIIALLALGSVAMAATSIHDVSFVDQPSGAIQTWGTTDAPLASTNYHVTSAIYGNADKGTVFGGFYVESAGGLKFNVGSADITVKYLYLDSAVTIGTSTDVTAGQINWSTNKGANFVMADGGWVDINAAYGDKIDVSGMTSWGSNIYLNENGSLTLSATLSNSVYVTADVVNTTAGFTRTLFSGADMSTWNGMLYLYGETENDYAVYMGGQFEAYGALEGMTLKKTSEGLSYSFAAPAVPEPTTATLSLLALAGLAARRRRK